jgi:hypothetical protein
MARLPVAATFTCAGETQTVRLDETPTATGFDR